MMSGDNIRISVRTVAGDLGRNAKPLIATEIAFKLISFAILSPLLNLLFRLFLALSGRNVIADTDIAVFFLHPVGWITALVMGGVLLAVQALEQSALVTVLIAESQGRPQKISAVLRFLGLRATGLVRLTTRIVARILMIAVPFLIAGGGLYLLLLTNHDINYYLAEKPPRFWLAVALIGGILISMSVVIIQQVVGWTFAVQIYLFEVQDVDEALEESKRRVRDRRKKIFRTIAGWVGVSFSIAFILALLVLLLSRWILPDITSPVWKIAVLGSLVLVMIIAVSFINNLIITLSLAAVLTRLYLQTEHAGISLPEEEELAESVWPRFTRGRILAAFSIATLTAALFLVQGLQAIDRDVDVQVTAHRGASGDAPENTLASVKLAIEKGADWVEIDVQESKDGIVVVAHDSDLKKVAGEDVKIWEATAGELRQIDIGSYFDPSFKDERVPTLEEVLEECRGRVNLNIELKYYGHDEALETKVVELVEKHEMQDHVVVMSLKSEGIQKVKKLRPEWTVGLLTAVRAGDLTRVDADFLAVKTTIATSAFIQQSHLREKTVSVWTVNDEVTMATMIRRGADNLITDYPAMARKVISQLDAMSPAESLLFDLALLLGENPLGAVSIDAEQ